MPNFSKMTDSELSLFIHNFGAIASINLAAVGYVAGDISLINNSRSELDSAITAAEAARQASIAATANLRSKRKAAQLNVSGRVRLITANSAITLELKAQLGIPPPDTVPSTHQPHAPMNLSVTAPGTHENQLRWKGNHNKERTLYDIYARIGDSLTWNLIMTVTARKFLHTGRTPGERIVYHVVARRGIVESGASNEAVIYD